MTLEGYLLAGGAVLISILWGILLGIGKKAVSIASQAVTEISKIAGRMDVFEAHNQHQTLALNALTNKFDKVDLHSEKIAVLESKVLQIKEIDERLREVEHDKRNTNS